MVEYVILDIETTGLDPEHASIIEVAAIVIRSDKIVDKFSSLIEYKGIIPEAIKRITGISENTLIGAPPLEDVLVKFRSFIAKRPVVSHNGFSFDFPTLEKFGVKFDEKYDSMEFAFFVIPTSPHGHSMDALSQHFGLPEVKHRALADCEAELEVIRKLQTTYSKRKKKDREALKWLARHMEWWWVNLLPGGQSNIDLVSSFVDKYEPYRKKDVKQEVLTLSTNPIDIAEVESKFTPQKNGDDYSEDRPEQRKMAGMIAQAFNERRHAVIEAGTGTGKSKAYLVPSLLFALKNGVPVIVSTHTKALQDQLYFKEIPHLQKTIHPNLYVAVLKGKQNYVCVKRFEEFFEEVVGGMAQRSLYEFGMETSRYSTRLACLLITSWLFETNRGDWDELPYWLKERIPKRIELEVCNTDELCSSGTCELYDDQRCFLARARLRARDADLVIINHALTLAGIIIEDKDNGKDSIPGENGKHSRKFRHTIFPSEARFIVFDEAHHLEDNATSAWEYRVSNGTLQLLLQQLFGKRGVKQSIEFLVKRGNSRVLSFVDRFSNQEGDIRLIVKLLFEDYLPTLLPKKDDRNLSSYRMLDPISQDEKKLFNDSIKNLIGKLSEVSRIISSVVNEIEEPRSHKSLRIRLDAVYRIIKSLRSIVDDDSNFVRYLERSGSEIEIKSSPISVAEHIKEYVLDNFSSVIMTSATLTVDGSFKFFAQRCGTTLLDTSKVAYQHFKSSFNYQKQVKFFAPLGIAYEAKRKDDHFEKSAAFLEKAVIASGGGSLILCSSHEQVGRLYDRLIDPLSASGIWLLRQSRASSVSSIIRDFKKDINSVLIGTETLWQGIDIPGESLRSLFIYKIPYRMPEIPIIKARCEKIRSAGGNAYSLYYEPLAAIILKQGFGRLIRKARDIGVVVLLDEKIMQKEAIRKSLPEGVRPTLAEPEFIFEELKRVEKLVADGQFNVERFNE